MMPPAEREAEVIGQTRRIVRLYRGLETRPWLMWAAVLLLALVAVTGLARLRFDDELIRFFTSDTQAFHDYVALARGFEGDSNDVIVLVEAPDVAAPKVAAALSDFVLEAQFVPGVRTVMSPLSLTVETPAGPEPLFPFPPPAAADMAARLDAAFTTSPALATMMAEDRSALLVVLPITEVHTAPGASSAAPGATRSSTLAALARLGDRLNEASGAEVRFAGYPVLRESVARALMRDILLLNGIGVLVGLAIAVATFRSLRLALLTLPGPVMGAALTVGLHGHFGVAINTITIALPVLVLVLGTSDAVHIGFERARQGGRAPVRAALRATRRVAVACLFAGLTTAIAFAALAFSRSQVIAELGRMGMVVTLAASLTVLLTQTAVLATAGRAGWFRPLYDRLHGAPPSVLRLERLPALALTAPRAVAWGGLALLVATTLLHAQAGPRYSLMDSLHEGSPVRAVFERVEEKVTPVSRIQVPVVSTDPAVIARVAEIMAEVMEAQSGAKTGAPNVQSIAAVEGGVAVAEARLPESLLRRLVSADGRTTLVSAAFAYENGAQAIRLADALDASFTAATATDPALAGVEIRRATGLPVMSARVAGVVLDEINRSLLIALAGVGLLILLWLRNPVVALLSLVPNMLPVTLIGATLMLSGRGIEFSNAIALTVAFGIAVDDTLHVLNRLVLTGGVTGLDRTRLGAALKEAAPALVTTSTVLVLGMSGTQFAENKAVSDFGLIAMSVCALALPADLLLLPALLARFAPGSRFARRRRS